MRRVACASVQLKFVVAGKELRRGVVDATEYSCCIRALKLRY